jgi:hypothetical protein
VKLRFLYVPSGIYLSTHSGGFRKNTVDFIINSALIIVNLSWWLPILAQFILPNTNNVFSKASLSHLRESMLFLCDLEIMMGGSTV